MYIYWASQVVLVVKNLPANAGDVRDSGLIPGLGRCLEDGMATHSNILAWKIPWTKELGRLHSDGSQRLRQSHMILFHACTHYVIYICVYLCVYIYIVCVCVCLCVYIFHSLSQFLLFSESITHFKT